MLKKSPNQTKLPLLGVDPPDLLVSLATVPMLLGLVGSKVLTNAIQELGQLSEEVFRGDRLPLLKLSSSNAGSPGIESPNTNASSINTLDVD